MNGTNPLPGYAYRQSYEWNYDRAPDPAKTEIPSAPGTWEFFGRRVGSPLGIAAGPLLNGRWILYYASLGFDVLTYKTVRGVARDCYPMPNLQPVNAAHASGREMFSAIDEMRGSWAVSFGMPSRAPETWRGDIEKTRSLMPKEKVLSVSVVATPEPDWSIQQLADDYALCAKWAIESGADCVEANFSCPNVQSSDGQLYQQPKLAGAVAEQIRQSIGQAPLLVKIGQVTDADLAGKLISAVAPHASALVMVNCIAAKVVDASGGKLFDGGRRGIAGRAIRQPVLEQLRLFAGLIREAGSNLKLIGVGGISTAEDVKECLAAGCCSVQLATAAMLNPQVGIKIRRGLAFGK